MGTLAMELCWLEPAGRPRSSRAPGEQVRSVLVTEAHERLGEISASREKSLSAGVLHFGGVREGGLLPCRNSHNSDPRILNGSQAKTAYALKHNAQMMVEEVGVDCVGFLTLTVGDFGPHRFKQVKDFDEASRRINNLNRRVLKDLFEKWIIVTERHKSGAIHFHILGVIRGRPDIRSGFDFEAVGRRDYRSASSELRGIWERLREVLPNYGFGRSELMPVRKTGDAVAGYIAKYIEKNIQARPEEDKGRKLVRYLGWDKEQLKANEFGWAGKRSRDCRRRFRETAAVIGCQSPEECAEALGPRWAYVLTMVWLSVHGGRMEPGIGMDLPQRMTAYSGLMEVAKKRGWKKPYEEAAHRQKAESGLELDDAFFLEWPKGPECERSPKLSQGGVEAQGG